MGQFTIGKSKIGEDSIKGKQWTVVRYIVQMFLYIALTILLIILTFIDAEMLDWVRFAGLVLFAIYTKII